MPKFYKQNKKRIDPRYFLNETTLNEESEDKEDILKDAEKLLKADGDWTKVKSTYQDAYTEGKPGEDPKLTAYGKKVEEKYQELKKSSRKKTKSGSRTVSGRLKAADKASRSTPKVTRTGKQIRENANNLREDINDDDDLSLKYILKFTDNGRARPEFEEIERKFTNDRIVQFAIADILRIASNQKRDLERIRQAQRILMNMQYGDAAAEELLRAINHCRKG